jgi:2-polyprenyl-6-methoxyphenol hydroxylase-like FAD-dependent oxidoreductase
LKTTQVLIIGGGPVGMTLAIALSRLGIKSILANDRKGTTSHPKLDVVNCRSMEIYHQLGLADKIRSHGNPLDANQYVAFATSAGGKYLSILNNDKHLVYQSVNDSNKTIRSTNDGKLPFQNMQRIPQMHLEPVLLKEIQDDENIECLFGWSLFGFEQDDEGVTALIQDLDTSKNQHIRADYLIGCDGPNSKVRNFLNIDYDNTRDLIGELFIIHFQSDELKELFPNQQPYWHTWLCQPKFGGLLVSPDASRNDYVLHRPFAPRKSETAEEAIEKAIGKKISFKIIQSGPWRPQFLVAKNFGSKRVFIAGDATHQYMPTGGLGMNTGVVEAHNLAWKLAATLEGWGGPALLESYETERLPIARRNREHVKKCAAAVFESQFAWRDYMLEESAEAEKVRSQLKQDFESKIPRLYESLGIEIGYRYHQSPINCQDEDIEPPYEERAYFPTSFIGSRVPSTRINQNDYLYYVLAYQEFTLLDFEGSKEATKDFIESAKKIGIPIKVLQITDQELKNVYERKYVLIRPDHHVCWRSDSIPSNYMEIINTIRGFSTI